LDLRTDIAELHGLPVNAPGDRPGRLQQGFVYTRIGRVYRIHRNPVTPSINDPHASRFADGMLHPPARPALPFRRNPSDRSVVTMESSCKTAGWPMPPRASVC